MKRLRALEFSSEENVIVLKNLFLNLNLCTLIPSIVNVLSALQSV